MCLCVCVWVWACVEVWVSLRIYACVVCVCVLMCVCVRMLAEQAPDILLAGNWALGREWDMLAVHERFPDSDDEDVDLTHRRRGAEPSAAPTAEEAAAVDVD